MFKRTSDTTAFVKAFVKNDWVWVDVVFRPQDLFKRGVHEWKECNPKLVKQGKKYFLHVSYEGEVTFTQRKNSTSTYLCSRFRVNQLSGMFGTGCKRHCPCAKIHSPSKRKRPIASSNELFTQSTTTNRICIYASLLESDQRFTKTNLKRYGCSNHRFAKQHHVHTIVFEYLDKMRIPKGVYGAKKLRFKLHYWAKKGIQNKVEEMAHYEGMRISRVNPRNTSKYAFDGSGEVKRSPRGDLAIFSNGKQYHADLSASYNIGARYFIREIQKSISEKEWSELLAKVPTLTTRTKQTLASFITLRTVFRFS